MLSAADFIGIDQKLFD